MKLRVFRYLIGGLLALNVILPSASAKLFDGGIESTNLGKGEWIYILSQAVNQFSDPGYGPYVPSVTSIDSMFAYCKSNLNCDYIVIKAGEGGALFNGPQFTPGLVASAHARGLKVFGYTRSYGTDLPGESSIADYVYGTCGADGFIFDAESQWESQNLPNNTTLAWQLCGMVKTNWPTKFLGHSPAAIINYHSTFPYKEFGYWCDAAMPQDYWVDFADNGHGTPTSTIQWMDQNWGPWQSGLTGIYTNSIKPLAPIGQADVPASQDGTDITEFYNYLKTDPTCVTKGGYKSCSFWRVGLQSEVMLSAIAAGIIGDHAPTITNQPQSQTVVIGQVASFTVVAGGPPAPKFQWRKNGTNIASATLSSYSRANVQLSDAGTYSVVVTNSQGSLTSANAILSVASAAQPPSILTPPQSQAVAAAQNATFTVSASGTATLKYQWFFNGSAVSSATTTAYTVTNAQAGNVGSYFVRVTNGVGSVTSQVATLAVVADVIVESHQPNATKTPFPPYSDAGFLDSTGKSSVGGLTGSGSRYASGSSGTPSCTFKPTLPVAGGAYDVSVTHTLSNCSADMVATVTQSACSGLPATTTVFQSAVANTWASVGRMVADAGVNSPSITFTYSGGTLSGTARMYSDAVKFSLSSSQPPIINTPPQSRSAYVGNAVTFTEAASGTPPLTYQWLRNGASISGATQGTYTIGNVQFPDGASYSVVVSNAVGAATSAAATLTVHAPTFTLSTISVSVDGKTHLQLTGDPDNYIVESSLDFNNWLALTNLVITNGPVTCTDPVTNNPARFYRARVGP